MTYHSSSSSSSSRYGDSHHYERDHHSRDRDRDSGHRKDRDYSRDYRSRDGDQNSHRDYHSKEDYHHRDREDKSSRDYKYQDKSSSSSSQAPEPKIEKPISNGNSHHQPLEKKEESKKEEFNSYDETVMHGPVQRPDATQPNLLDFDKYDEIPVEMSGTNCPTPITSWSESDLSQQLLANLQICGYTRPTPVQKYSLPIVTGGRDLMSCAQTGSGKTAAFLLPMIHQISSVITSRSAPTRDRFKASPFGLVLAPTRELAVQIQEEARKFSARTHVKTVVVYGGSSIGLQLRELERGCDLLVATPGRLVDIINKGKASMAFVRFLVLDEADRMLDMGFEPQIRTIVQKHDMPNAGVRQTLMFSATFAKEVQVLASSFLHNYIFLTIGRVGRTTDFVEQRFVHTETEKDKQDKLLELLRAQSGLTLIFVETKKKAGFLDMWLRRHGFAATSIHGDRQQTERMAALKSFSSGQTPYLIATNVAARGLDISNIAHVINYDMPSNVDDYVHRIGRTGRIGNKGISTAFIGEENISIVGPLLGILADVGQDPPQFMKDMQKDNKFYKKSSKFGGRDVRNTGEKRKRDFGNNNNFNQGNKRPRNESQQQGYNYYPPSMSYMGYPPPPPPTSQPPPPPPQYAHYGYYPQQMVSQAPYYPQQYYKQDVPPPPPPQYPTTTPSTNSQ